MKFEIVKSAILILLQSLDHRLLLPPR